MGYRVSVSHNDAGEILIDTTDSANVMAFRVARQIIATRDVLIQRELKALGWTPPIPPMPPKLPVKCIVKGCKNHSNEGKFIGDLCAPCFGMLTTGIIIVRGTTFIADLQRDSSELQTIKSLFRNLTKETQP